MTHSALATETHWTHQKSSRDGARVDRFIVHHAANSSIDQTLYLFDGAREVSANYALGNGRIAATVPEEQRAWTSGSYNFDRRAITVEVSNSRTGDPWPVADVEFDNLARLIADVASRYGFDINDGTVLTHQELYTRFGESYATACPGDMQRRKGELIALARSYQGKGPAPAPKPSTPVETPVSFPAAERYGEEWVAAMQEDLDTMGHSLAVDGLDGDKTQGVVAFEQKKAGENGYGKIAIDRIGGPELRGYLDWWFDRIRKVPAFPLPTGWWFGPEDGPERSVSGYHGNRENVRRLQRRLNKVGGYRLVEDGLYGQATAFAIKVEQNKRGLSVDGEAGVKTWTAIWS